MIPYIIKQAKVFQCLTHVNMVWLIDNRWTFHKHILVVGFNPSEKSSWESSPNRDDNKIYLKPPPSILSGEWAVNPVNPGFRTNQNFMGHGNLKAATPNAAPPSASFLKNPFIGVFSCGWWHLVGILRLSCSFSWLNFCVFCWRTSLGIQLKLLIFANGASIAQRQNAHLRIQWRHVHPLRIHRDPLEWYLYLDELTWIVDLSGINAVENIIHWSYE